MTEAFEKRLKAGEINAWAHEVNGTMSVFTAAFLTKIDTFDVKYLKDFVDKTNKRCEDLLKDMSDIEETKSMEFSGSDNDPKVIDQFYPKGVVLSGKSETKKSNDNLTEDEQTIYDDIKNGDYKKERGYPEIGSRRKIGEILQRLQDLGKISKTGEGFKTVYKSIS